MGGDAVAAAEEEGGGGGSDDDDYDKGWKSEFDQLQAREERV